MKNGLMIELIFIGKNMNKFYCLLFLFSYCFASDYSPECCVEDSYPPSRPLHSLEEAHVAMWAAFRSSYRPDKIYKNMSMAMKILLGDEFDLKDDRKTEEMTKKNVNEKRQEINQIGCQNVKSREDLEGNLSRIQALKSEVETLEYELWKSRCVALQLEYEKRFPSFDYESGL